MDKAELARFIGSKIRYFRKNLGLTQEELGAKIGTQKSRISNYERGYRSPKQNDLFKLADVLNISIDDLFPETESSTPTSPDADELTSLYMKLDDPRKRNVFRFTQRQWDEQKRNQIHESRSLYRVDAIECLCAGRGYSYGNNEVTAYYTDRSDLKAHDFASRVTGDSMEPTYHDGDIVLIRQGYDSIDGEIYAVDYDGKSYLKKIYVDGHKLRMHSLNPKYDDILIDLPTDGYLNIIGKVVDKFKPVEA